MDFKINKDVFTFKYLPEFAHFLLNNKLEEFVTIGIRFCKEVDLPILKPLSKFTERELVQLSIETNRELLESIATNKIANHIAKGLDRYTSNTMGYIEQEDLLAEDLTMGFHLRRKIFTYFLDAYTKNMVTQKLITAEVDIFTTQEELIAYSIFLKVQQEKLTIQKDLLLQTQELAGIGSFFINVKDDTKTIFTPQYLKIIEFDNNPTYDEFINYIHPEDRANFKRNRENALAGGQFEFEYRYNKSGIEKRIWTNGIVDLENGTPVLMKGSIRDITAKHMSIQQLKDTQKLYEVGQELNNFGSWLWDLSLGTLLWSKEMYSIFEIANKQPITLGEFLSHIHEDDRDRIKKKIEVADSQTDKQEYTFKITTPSGTLKTLKGKSRLETNGQKLITRCYGTCELVIE